MYFPKIFQDYEKVQKVQKVEKSSYHNFSVGHYERTSGKSSFVAARFPSLGRTLLTRCSLFHPFVLFVSFRALLAELRYRQTTAYVVAVAV